MARKPQPSHAADRVRQKMLDVLRAAGGTLRRDQLRNSISTALPAATLDQVTAELVQEGLVEVETLVRSHQGYRGNSVWYFVTEYRLTPRGEIAAGGPKS